MSTPSVSLPGFLPRSSGWSIVLSVLMILAGLLAIAVPPAAGVAATIFVGWMLVFSGVVHFVYAWQAHGAGSVIWEILVGIAYLFIGGYLLYHPLRGMASLTLALALYLFVESIFEFIIGVQLRPRRGNGWLFVHGVITLILAFMIWRTWPSSAGWVLGILIGIGMLFSGITRLMISLATRKLVAQPT